jgi:hypothetical protein
VEKADAPDVKLGMFRAHCDLYLLHTLKFLTSFIYAVNILFVFLTKFKAFWCFCSLPYTFFLFLTSFFSRLLFFTNLIDLYVGDAGFEYPPSYQLS